jgi:hypothetical protein
MNGLTLELWLDRTTINVGDRVTALARISNRGTSTVMWESNVCTNGPAHVVVYAEWATSPFPVDDGVANEFRRQILDSRPNLVGGFRDAKTIDVENVGCFAYAAPRRFKPGDSAEMVVAWDANGRPGYPVTPGPATIRSTFRFWEVGTPWPPPEKAVEEFSLSQQVEIKGAASGEHSVAEYVDAALADPQFKDWLNRHPIDQWINPSVAFWPNAVGAYPSDPIYANAKTGAVDISLFASGSGGGHSTGRVTLDATTLAVLGRHLDK